MRMLIVALDDSIVVDSALLLFRQDGELFCLDTGGSKDWVEISSPEDGYRKVDSLIKNWEEFHNLKEK